MIILEGTDNVGKTTAARAIAVIMAERLRVDVDALYGHMSKPRDDLDHVQHYCSGVRMGVQDRFHLGSIVYGRILGGGGFISRRDMLVVQSYLRWMGCWVVIFTCDTDELARRIKASGDREEMYRTDQILMAGEAYRALTLSSNMGEPYCDEVVDVTQGWPDEKFLGGLVDRWMERFQR